MTQEHNRSTGFTIIELMLAMGFVSVLLLSIALLTIQISGIYNKGLTIRAVNEAGQALSTDITRTLNTSQVEQIRLVEGRVDGGDVTGGRLCTERTTYAWNFGSALRDPSTAFNTFETPSTPERAMRFVRFDAFGKDYCSNASGDYLKIPDGATELLTDGDVELALHSFTVRRPAGASPDQLGYAVPGDQTQRMYPVSFSLGTLEDAVIGGGSCSGSPSGIDDQYCAVNRFVFTARAGNRGEEE